MLSRAICYIILLFISIRGNGQEIYFQKPAKFITQIPFIQLTGGVILLQAKFDTIETPLNFILDTGSGAISLDSATVEEFKIPHEPSGRVVGGIAGTREVDYAKNNTLILPQLRVDSLDFYINDYNILSSVYGLKIDGIIGYSFLKKFIVKVNFDSSYLQIYEPGSMIYPQGGAILRPVFSALPILRLYVKDQRSIESNFYFDTGAGLSFLMTSQFQKDSALLKKKRRPQFIQVQGLGGRKQMQLTIISSLQIGPYKFRQVPANILNDEFNVISYPSVGGLIGNDLLRRFNLILNYPQRQIHLLPNSHFQEKFDYSYTGISMYYIEDEDKIYLDEIIKKSPADKAGLRKGDVVVGINGNFSNNINIYKNLMNEVGTNVKLVLLRDNKPVILTMRVGKIH
ncbi:MAG: aspartyl protease family protein [Bacteroidetes bacterium]|nr:aspartyl protease family protein [Bacteroidota bacterium]